MKFLSGISLTLGILASGVAALPPVETVTVQLANEQSGAHANVKIPTDNSPHPISALWGHTAVAAEGVVSASSAQLNQFDQDTVCKIVQAHPHVDATLNARQTWVSLADGKVVELSHGFIVCH
ncbi:uncharacterized protein ASPGLDRAFT_1345695 [Aspergillus glaucus CBS 516.65]|uniref:Uncharacterized protein n=1 Tax=Aspergillus glaucus CBS 516.65 TaxID=1160497 RepID=A0A1L9VN92_ASPGL|nr:hypothetical protein ASPGLDRAFT_1345695 [Aspergillus glaucus CBS 516.65]OJJ85383.1 hypothetical protein ASPGLDRAFT_1345695 [Aspergillus glaucus CBS 516.65]